MEEAQTERLSSFLGNPTAPPMPCLVALKGPETGQSIPLRLGKLVLGRSADQADLVVTGRGISRAHATLDVLSDSEIHFTDLNSTNGVFLNGERVTSGQLKVGDTLALGPEVVLRLEVDSMLQQVVQDLYRGANLDALTGVLNRRSFLDRVREELAAAQRHGYATCLALTDVDHFKSINDTYGHPAGDAVLVSLAQTLSQQIRLEDLVGRYGGEEFILFLRFADRDGAWVGLERIRQAVAQMSILAPTSEGERRLTITTSIGFTLMPPTAQLEQAIQEADQALYQAKRGGRNRTCFALDESTHGSS